MAQLLNQIIKALFIHVLGVLLIITLFHMYYSNQNEKHEILTLQVEGLSYIYKLSDIKDNIQKIRGLYQIVFTTNDKEDKNKYTKRILALKTDIFRKLQDLKILENIDDTTLSIKNTLEKNKKNSMEVFKNYTSLMVQIEKLYIKIADKYQLQLEADRINYFLMQLSINDIPLIQEEFAKLRGYGTYLIGTNKINKENVSKINYYIENIQRKRLDIQTYIKLIKDKKGTYDELNFMQNRLKNNIEKTNFVLESLFIKKQRKEKTINYYNFVSQSIIDTNEFFLKTHQYLKENLQNKKQSLKTQLFYSWVLVTLILLGLITAFIISIIKIFRAEDTKYKQFVLKEFKHALQDAHTLKDVCNVSLNKVCRYYKALEGVIYLYNNQNKKLYLGATYGIHEDNIETILSLGESDIGQVAKDATPMVRSINAEDSNRFLPSSKNIHIEPIIHEDKVIAVIEFTTIYKIQEDKNISTALNEIMSSYIYDSTLLKHTEEMIQLIDENIITSQTNINGIITNVSSAFAQISGYTKEEMIGRDHNILKHPDVPEELFTELWEEISNGNSWEGELKNLKKDGSYYWVKTYIYPNYDLYKNIVGYTAIRQEITDKKHIEELSIRDSMTSLYNRRYFETIFDEILTKTKQSNSLLTFAMIDVDHFKLYNDTYGHQKGDSTLKAVADILKERTKDHGEYAFRLGGEEFGILFEIDSIPSANKLLNKIKEDVEILNIKHKKNTASEFVTISIGFFVIEPQMNLEINQIYKYADEALYKAKENGRNCIESNTHAN